MENQIKEILKELDNAEITEKREDELLVRLPQIRVLKAQKTTKDSVAFNGLSEKQIIFFNDIREFFNSWIESKIDKFLALDESGQQLPSNAAIKVTILRIEEVLTGANFSEIVDTFNFIKDGNQYSDSGKYGYLNNDFGD